MQNVTTTLTLDEANRIAELPTSCIIQEYPNKLAQVLSNVSDLKPPHQLHPAFYGCFDWHSAVHGHWTLVSLLQKFPQLRQRELIRKRLQNHISKENILQEVAYFSLPHNQSYERPYGWAWLLKLQEALLMWEDDLGKELAENLEPLADFMVASFGKYLKVLQYPIRTGTHTNTAFSLSLAHDFATTVENRSFLAQIEDFTRLKYGQNKQAAFYLEPSGYDFLSPTLTEISLVAKVYSSEEFDVWLEDYFPSLKDKNLDIHPVRVNDRTDGQLVHLDGLNFSRAWCFYNLEKLLPHCHHLKILGDEHIAASLPLIVDGNYEGTHWLGSFAVLALQEKDNTAK